MRIKISCLIPFLLAATINTAGAAERIEGTWVFSTDAGGPRPVCALVQNGEIISGDCKGPTNQGPITGKVSGKKIEFSWAGSTPDVRKKFVFVGQWDSKAGTIMGKVTWTVLHLARPDVITPLPPPAPLDFIATKMPASLKTEGLIVGYSQ